MTQNHFKLFQTISNMDLSKHGLSAPHGLDFSPDGKYLVATHKPFFKDKLNLKGDSALAIYECETGSDFGLNIKPILTLPYEKAPLHLVVFHPSKNIIAVAKEKLGIDIFNWNSDTKTMEKRDTISLLQVDDGAKGISFTKDGNQVVVTTPLNEILFFDLK